MKLNILLIEDDEIDYLSIQKSLDMPIHHAWNGEEALEWLDLNVKESQFILIILDINMPRMNGIEFLEELKKSKHAKQAIVTILTTSNENKTKLEAYELGAAGYLLKPFKEEKLKEVLDVFKSYWNSCEYPV